MPQEIQHSAESGIPRRSATADALLEEANNFRDTEKTGVSAAGVCAAAAFVLGGFRLSDHTMGQTDRKSDETIKTIVQHDSRLNEESKTWSDLAANCYTKQSPDTGTADKLLNQVVRDSLAYGAARTMSDNHGWAKIWSNALSDPDNSVGIKLAQTLAEAYNAEAKKEKSSSRVSLDIQEGRGGAPVVTVERYVEGAARSGTDGNSHNDSMSLTFEMTPPTNPEKGIQPSGWNESGVHTRAYENIMSTSKAGWNVDKAEKLAEHVNHIISAGQPGRLAVTDKQRQDITSAFDMAIDAERGEQFLKKVNEHINPKYLLQFGEQGSKQNLYLKEKGVYNILSRSLGLDYSDYITIMPKVSKTSDR